MFCDAPDAGVFLNGADLLNHGALPSRDFVEPQGPGSFLWLALFFRFFGATLTTAHLVLDATGAAIALLAFYISRKLGASGFFAALFALVMSVPLMPIVSPHYDTNLFALAAFAIFLSAWDQALDRKQPELIRLIVTAVLCAITTWMIQQKGVYLTASLLISLVCLLRARSTRPVLILGLSYALLALLPFAIYAVLHALPDLLFANYLWPLRKYGELNAAPYAFPLLNQLEAAKHLPDVLALIPFVIAAALPLLLPITAAFAGRTWFNLRFLPYWLTAYALWLSELHRLDIGHLRNGAILIGIVCLSVCEASGKLWLRRAGLVITLFIALRGATDFMTALQPEKTMQARRGVVHVQDDAALIDFLNTHTNPGQDVFVYPYQPIYYFVENLHNPTRYSYLQYHLHTDDQFREATADLERKHVRYVVFDTLFSGENFQQVFPAYRQPPKSRLIMEPYLEAHYHVAANLGRFQILERTP